jgi:hyperosmotically inducible periplasmic protein
MASDTTIVTRVKTALATDPTVATQDINVQSVGGIVYLRGGVYTEAEREAAARVARSVPDVVDVRNMLSIIPIYRGGGVEEMVERRPDRD